MNEINADLLLRAYSSGYFPMAQSADSHEISWYTPQLRGVIPLDDFHVSRSLAKFLKKSPFTYSTDQCFRTVMQACAQRAEDTWINDTLITAYCQLHEQGHAHSVEVWSENEGQKQLVGGLYGVSLNGAFFGESMFSRTPNASKAALVHLVDLLNQAGYTLLDAQYVNEHLKQFGIMEIPREEYLTRLKHALSVQPEHCF
jgi:leucyl/phenylalanyl-tRNA--protein transferase